MSTSRGLENLSLTQLAEQAEQIGQNAGIGETVSYIGKNDDLAVGPPASKLAVYQLSGIVAELARRLDALTSADK